eukprot:4574693-Pyramimonas_sp.AAC.1
MGAPRVYDYFVCSAGVARGAKQVVQVQNRGFVPHTPVIQELCAGLAQMYYLTFRRPPELPTIVPFGPLPEP